MSVPIELAEQRTKILEASRYVLSRIKHPPAIALILGSGLGGLADSAEESTAMPYEQIPHFPVSTVEGHAGVLVSGKIGGVNAIFMKGRFHLYEGHPLESVTFPIRVMKAVGIRKLLVTNAAGGVNADFQPGDLMLIRDHINWMYRNPLIGRNDPESGVRFPDMSEAYSASFRSSVRQWAGLNGFSLREGVYAGFLGPTYETPAEIRMARKLGADAVGMSTVPEVIAARHAGFEVLGISCITNMAAGILDQPLSHEEVMATADRVKDDFARLVKGIIPLMEDTQKGE
ncbi:purine-nucleoside phosphorylase [Ferviditalea candida]|uniref:Purine nucleoside phosphorylase n=1 Tax=Ferviditalea candida TaxID=3108399 RepID=A0ABU5ZJU1_9BACL|nr:purine-nucleoside phosphorylase [Paenibacillaceae bacterium T2]